jgi:DNA-binding PadR family transcriptional regulator
MLRYALLGLLARQPSHGYDLKNEIENALGGNWEINFGQIYTTLSRLERDGLVSGTDETADARGKRVYEITSTGRSELEGWLNRPIENIRQLRNEFITKLIIRHLAGYGDTQPAIAQQRQAYLQQLRSLNTLASQKENDHFVSLLIEGAILHLQADLRWLDLCEERLENLDQSS